MLQAIGYYRRKLPTCADLTHSPTLQFHRIVKTKTLIFRIGSDGGLHMVPTFRGERNSALATWKGTLLQMFDLSTEGGRTRLRQRSPLRLKALSPPKAPWHRCPPGCSRVDITLHTDAIPVVHQRLSVSLTQSADQVPPETAVERLHLIVRTSVINVTQTFL